jgi:hypothetical protein
MTSEGAKLYLDLMESALVGALQREADLRHRYLRACLAGTERFDPVVNADPVGHRPAWVAEAVAAEADGRFPDGSIGSLGFPRTMCGRARLRALRAVVEDVLAAGVPGDLIECGVWRGGSGMMMKAVLRAHGDTTRRVWMADSFRGLPPPRLPQDAGLWLTADLVPELAVPRAEVERGFASHGLLDDRICWLEGWFSETLAGADTGTLAVLRLDGDLYESTKDALVALYDRLSPGGWLIVDDYGAVEACRVAVADFFAGRGEPEPAWQVIDWTGVQARKAAP